MIRFPIEFDQAPRRPSVFRFYLWAASKFIGDLVAFGLVVAGAIALVYFLGVLARMLGVAG